MAPSAAGAHDEAASPSTSPRAAARPVDVVGHGFVMSERERAHVVEKMRHLDRCDDGIKRYQVAVFHEHNPRQAKRSDRVQITGTGRGVTVRVQASGSGFHPAFAAALAKLEGRLHRAHERRVMRDHSGGHRNPVIDTTA
ncbi:HPF/RaiA family ribosome-associated protein [Pseudonocardia halophobica]|uniref:HPF/RaiA family ribosome-associated protein n=1 Tax=Pseudonocardia halophobica TaxID=29401 RepID=UPI003D8FF9F9